MENLDNKTENLDHGVNHAVENAVKSIKETVTAPFDKPPSIKSKSSVGDLKNRLEWGEPALTIIDVRDRASFNQERIMGAITMEVDGLAEQARAHFEPNRDIYIYGDSDEATSQTAQLLRGAGFVSVAEIEGGLSAWKSISGPVEGTAEVQEPDAGAYNVVARVNQHQEAQKGHG